MGDHEGRPQPFGVRFTVLLGWLERLHEPFPVFTCVQLFSTALLSNLLSIQEGLNALLLALWPLLESGQELSGYAYLSKIHLTRCCGREVFQTGRAALKETRCACTSR